MNRGTSWDLIVVGAGPAGTAAAINARRLGLRVLLIEASLFPRHHVGESLVNLWEPFEILGVADELDATFEHKRGAVRIWGEEVEPHASSFDYLPGPRRYSLQVERSLFDHILLRRAETMGAVVRQGHRVTSVLWEGERAAGVCYRGLDGSEHEARAPFLFDASGRAGLISRARGLRVRDPFYADLAVYAYMAGAERFPGENAGNLLIEAVAEGWFWFIPLHTGEVSVGLVCDKSSRPALRREGAAGFFERAVGSSTQVRRMLASATVARGPFVTASGGYTCDRYAGPGWFIGGDAGAFSDPMWATGVSNALTDGLMCGFVVEAVLAGRIAEKEGVAFYDDLVRDRAADNDALVKYIYGRNRLYANAPFWRNRHCFPETKHPPVASLQRIAREPFAAYFRSVIASMGADPGTLALLDAEQLMAVERTREAAALARDTRSWVPARPDRTQVTPGLGLINGRLGRGQRVGTAPPLFIGQPEAIALLRSVDGQRSAADILDELTATAPAGQVARARFRLLGALQRLHGAGAVTSRESAPV